MWQLWQVSQAYNCRPSSLLGIEDPSDAFRLDRAVWYLGTELTGELNSVEGKTDKEVRRKQEMILRKWIPEAAETRQYADPAARGTTL